MPVRGFAWPLLLTGAFLGTASTAAAQTQAGAENAALPGAPAVQANPIPGQTGTGLSEPPGAPLGFWRRDRLLGDPGGVRSRLEGHGISFGLSETSEVFGNLTGGRTQGVAYEGLTEMSLGIDLHRAVGLAGGSMNASALQIHGHGLSTGFINNLNTVSDLEATPATRLFELWYQQAFLDGRMDVRLGQQSADLEFATSQYAGLFINASFGWPTSFAVDLPASGPSYPLAAVGVRLRARPIEKLTLLLGIFNGSPSGFGEGDPQGARNPSGTSFRVGDGTFVIAEAQYAADGDENPWGLPGVYKLGAWYNSNAFTNQFFTVTEGTAPLAPSGIPPRAGRGDWTLYAMLDQLIWRPAGAKDGGIGVFARATGGPGDRNLVSLFMDGGITYKGVFGQQNDTVGLGVGWARIGDAARDRDLAVARQSVGFGPVRTREVVLEVSYQHQIAPWWQVQPDFQYVFNPGGGLVNPDRPDQRLGDAAIFGLRTSITF